MATITMITIMVMDIVTAMIMVTITVTVTVIVNHLNLDLFRKRTIAPVVIIPPRLLRLPAITITIMITPP